MEEADPCAALDPAEGRALGRKALQCFLEAVDNSIATGVPQTRRLVDVLMTKSAPIQAAVTSVEMLRAALPPSAARLLALIRAEKGDAALLAAVDAILV